LWSSSKTGTRRAATSESKPSLATPSSGTGEAACRGKEQEEIRKREDERIKRGEDGDVIE